MQAYLHSKKRLSRDVYIQVKEEKKVAFGI